MMLAGLFAGVLAYAYTVARFTEARTDQIRKWIFRPRVGRCSKRPKKCW
jgi:hypothetical protein